MRRDVRRLVVSTLFLALGAASCSSATTDTAAQGSTPAPTDTSSAGTIGPDAAGSGLPDAYVAYESPLYGDLANWMCSPRLPVEDDVCKRNQDLTVVMPGGTTTIEVHVVAEDPPADCFYIYPTISGDPTANSDLKVGEGEEVRAVLNQAGRFSSTCRVFAPVYRQRTLAALSGAVDLDEQTEEAVRALAYNDVLDAWRHYITTDNGGRDVILMGHSQGAGVLSRLLAEEIEPSDALWDRVVGAYLLGTSVSVPQGEVLGGQFVRTPVCTEVGETHCVVTYASFRSTSPPPSESFFGRSREGVAACTDPTTLDGGDGELRSYFVSSDAAAATGVTVDTPFVSWPGLTSAACVSDGEFTYLEITVHPHADDAQPDDIGGDLTPVWGLHLVDVNLAMGNLVEIARRQTGQT